MVTSVLEIYNLAITRLGHEPMSSEGENTKAGRLCRLHYPTIRDAVLKSHPWNFAVRRATLAQLSVTPAFEYTYAYALPTDPYCLKVIRTSLESAGYSSAPVYGYAPLGFEALPVEYRIETIDVSGTPVRAMLINETEVSIEYIARITDVSLFDPMFVDCLAARLAAEMAIAISDNQSVTKTLMDLYQMKLSEARTMDAQEGSSRDVVNTDGWLIARL